jgi:hypothetical protein
MECNASDINEFDELLGQIGHHVLRAGHLALFGDLEAAEIEMGRAITLLNSTNP